MVFLLTSCSAIERNFNFDSNRYTKSSLGAAAGAAIGATAGTIIGSTSGDAGQGFLLGGGIGALSGAVIGTEMDSREERAYARNTIHRQNNQNQRLNTIRNNSFDGGSNNTGFQGNSYQNNNVIDSSGIGNGINSGATYNSGSSFDASGRFIIPEQNRPSAAYNAGSTRTYAAARQTQPTYITESDLAGTPSLPSSTYNITANAPSVRNVTLGSVTSGAVKTTSVHKIKKVKRARLKTNSFSTPKKITNRSIPLAKTRPITKIAKVNEIPLAKTFPIDKPLTKTVAPTANLGNAIVNNTASLGSAVIGSTASLGSAVVGSTASLGNAVVGTTTAVGSSVANQIKKVVSPSSTTNVGKAVKNCSDAESEATRARTAATDTDKIFYYRRALRLCKSKPNYHIEIGKVYASIGRKEEAEFEFSKALELSLIHI